jgi:hypothetical protein
MVSIHLDNVAALLEDKVVNDCPMPVIPSSVDTSTISIRLWEVAELGIPALKNGILIIMGRTLIIFLSDSIKIS